MSFVALGGDDAVRPTFFELVAAERLVPSLKAALVYSLSVYSQRRQWLHRVLDWEDEVWALCLLLLERQSLWTRDATFAESLYGLQRMPCGRSAAAAASASDGKRRTLGNQQRWQALLLVVALPYLKSKLEALYHRHRPRTQGPLGMPALSLQPSATAAAAANASAEPLPSWGLLAAWGGVARSRALSAFVAAYPWLHAGGEGMKFLFQLSYLLDSTQYYTPVLAALRQRVTRVSGAELAEQQRDVAARRAAQLQRVAEGGRGGAVGRAAAATVLRGVYLVADHTRTALIAAVFGFKLLEWWFTSAEQKLAGQRALPPPPPPPPPKPHPSGVPLPLDPALCALCGRLRTNPAQVTVSGYVFCYPCAFSYVSEKGACPVTLTPARPDHIRRLYQQG